MPSHSSLERERLPLNRCLVRPSYRRVSLSRGNVIEASSPQRWRNRDRRRQIILREAIRLLGDRGYDGFGLQELATNCGLSKPGLLHHFNSKEQLLVSVLEDRDARNEELVSTMITSAETLDLPPALVRSKLREIIRSIVAENALQPELVRFRVRLRSDSLSPHHPAYEYMRQSQKEKITRLAKNIAIFSINPENAARHVVTSVSGLEEQWIREDLSFDLAKVSSDIIDVIFDNF